MKTKIFLSKLNKNLKSDEYIKYILSKYFDFEFDKISIVKNKNGKPYLSDSKLNYSISHKNKYIIAIVSNEEIGIDMEIINDKNRLKIADKYFFKQEIDYINLASTIFEKNVRFLELWTKKEAYIKRYGLNLSYINRINSLKEDIFTTRIDDLIISICI